MDFVQFTEICMLILFGASWPFNIAKSLRSKTTKGKSMVFEVMIILAYIIGLSGKFVAYSRTGVFAYSIWFYLADIAMVATDLCLCFRNLKYDGAAEEQRSGK